MKILIFLLFLIPYAWSISEEEVRDSVLKNFLLIDEARLKLEAAKSEVIAAKGEFDHKLKFKSINNIERIYDNDYFETYIEKNTGLNGINLIAGHREGTGTFPPYKGYYETSGGGEIFAGISLPLLRDFSTDEARTNFEIALMEKEQAQEQLRLKQNIYVHKALSLYYKWKLELRKYHIRKNILNLAEQRIEMLDKRYKSGDLERIKLTDNNRSINKRKDEVLKSEVKLAKLEAELSLYLPQKTLNDFAQEHELLPENVRPMSQNLPVSIELSSVPQIKILEIERKKQQRLEGLYQQSRLPGLTANLLGAKELSPNQPYDRERIQVGFNFDFPLENRKAEGKTVAQTYKLMALEKQREYVNKEISLNFEYTLKAIKLFLSRWHTVSKEAESSNQMAVAEKRKWSQGSSDLFIVNLREEDVADAEIKRWSVLYEYQQIVIDAKLFSGTI